MSAERCIYCRKFLHNPCRKDTKANACANAEPSIRYIDREPLREPKYDWSSPTANPHTTGRE